MAELLGIKFALKVCMKIEWKEKLMKAGNGIIISVLSEDEGLIK